jgi:inner membrane protein
MPTIFTHAVVPAAIALGLGKKAIPRPLLYAGMILSVFPDADCGTFAMGIAYESQFGHRGFMHSLVFAAAMAGLWTWRNMEFNVDGNTVKRWVVFAYLFVSMASHGLLDMLTDGGKGVALFWPFLDERLFFPATPISVSNIGLSFLSERSIGVLKDEFVVIWLPCLVLGGVAFGLRHLLMKEKKA